jgi:hypothetical protein
MKELVKTTCTYCNSIADTKDHVPPKCMFPKPTPALMPLVTVPCCQVCNLSFCKDDEYLRDVITFRDELSDNPLVKQLNETVSKRFARTEAQGYFNSMHKSFGEEPIYTIDGIYLETKVTFDYDRSRIHKALERIVRGLYRIQTGIKLSDGFDVQVYTPEDSLSLKEEISSVIQTLPNKERFVVVPNGFNYIYYCLPSYPVYTGWKLCFYLKYDVFAITRKTKADPVGSTLQK